MTSSVIACGRLMLRSTTYWGWRSLWPCRAASVCSGLHLVQGRLLASGLGASHRRSAETVLAVGRELMHAGRLFCEGLLFGTCLASWASAQHSLARALPGNLSDLSKCEVGSEIGGNGRKQGKADRGEYRSADLQSERRRIFPLRLQQSRKAPADLARFLGFGPPKNGSCVWSQA